jgi:Ser-tRNA(Ala) deacylase AlaX
LPTPPVAEDDGEAATDVGMVIDQEDAPRISGVHLPSPGAASAPVIEAMLGSRTRFVCSGFLVQACTGTHVQPRVRMSLRQE